MAGELVLVGARSQAQWPEWEPLLRRPPAGLGAYDAADAYGVLVALAVRQAGPGSVVKITKALKEPFWLNDETWGMGPSAEEGAAAMEAMLAGNVPDSLKRRR